MPRFQALVGGLNSAFGKEQIQNLAHQRALFAPQQPLDEALATVVAKPGTAMHRAFKAYLSKLPGAISEALRSALHYALGTTPATLVTFAWAPGYDYEVTFWQSPDTKETRGGVTVLFKSRYPTDKHPILPP
jgi:hypothetical protein